MEERVFVLNNWEITWEENPPRGFINAGNEPRRPVGTYFRGGTSCNRRIITDGGFEVPVCEYTLKCQISENDNVLKEVNTHFTATPLIFP